MSTEGSIIRQIVDRCHVATRNVDVIKAVIRCINGERKTWKSFTRAQRRAIMILALKKHKQNRDLYFKVMRGI